MARWTMALALSATLWACDGEPYVPSGAESRTVVARIEVTIAAGEMFPGDTATAAAVGFTPGGDPIPLLDFNWQVTDSSVVALETGVPTETARVTALTLGAAALTARVGGVASAPVVLLVVEPDTTETGGP